MLKKRTFGEVAKVAAMSLAMVGVFGAALMGANRLAFANAASRTLEVPPFAAMSATQNLHASASSGDMGMTIANALSAEQSTRRDLIVKETMVHRWGWGSERANERSETALSAEEAAQIGAQYIYEMFGECIDGATVQMTFNGHMQHRGRPGVWTGVVGDGFTPEGVEFEMPLGLLRYIFMLNAETGEAIQVEYIANAENGIVIFDSFPDTLQRIELHSINPEIFGSIEIRYYREFNFESFNIWDASHRLPDDLRDFLETIMPEWEDFEWEAFDRAGNPHIIRRFSTTPPHVPQYPQGDEDGAGSGLRT